MSPYDRGDEQQATGILANVADSWCDETNNDERDEELQEMTKDAVEGDKYSHHR